MTTQAAHHQRALPTATVRETIGVAVDVVLPALAKGVIIRRPSMVALAARWDLDRRSVTRLQRLHARYGGGPLRLRLPRGVRYALVLSPDDVKRVLDQSPAPFSPASSEKRAALRHFQPRGVLISQGPARADRRRFNEAVLDTACSHHRLAARFDAVVDEETQRLLREAPAGRLDWSMFTRYWNRIVRRVVLGDGARNDEVLSAMLTRLRKDANWAFLHPQRKRLRARFLERLGYHLARAEAGSLAQMIAATPSTAQTAAVEQIPHWLFAFDAAAIATFRTLAVLCTHAEPAERVRAELAGAGVLPERRLLRACVLDTVRLWPTTPLVLRQSTTATTWDGGELAAGTGLIVAATFFHRDARRLPDADRFAPELWLDDQQADAWPLIPFSRGPAVCAGRNLVLELTSALLAALMSAGPITLLPPHRLDPRRPLPATLNHFGLRFAIPAGARQTVGRAGAATAQM